MRVFVGFAVPDDVRAALDEQVAPVRERYGACNWPPPDTWHVTLAFVGEIPDDRLDDVVAATREAVAGADLDRVELTVDGTGRFGQRVGWLRIADRPDGAVAALGGALQQRIADRELPVDRKEVRPHVTLVRARGGKGRLPSGLVDELPTLALTWEVAEATVYRSHLGPGPLAYEVLATVPLGG